MKIEIEKERRGERITGQTATEETRERASEREHQTGEGEKTTTRGDDARRHCCRREKEKGEEIDIHISEITLFPLLHFTHVREEGMTEMPCKHVHGYIIPSLHWQMMLFTGTPLARQPAPRSKYMKVYVNFFMKIILSYVGGP